MVNYLSKWLKILFLLEEIKAQREKEFNLLESTGLEAPNFTNSKHLDNWLEWDGEFDSMLKEKILNRLTVAPYFDHSYPRVFLRDFSRVCSEMLKRSNC